MQPSFKQFTRYLAPRCARHPIAIDTRIIHDNLCQSTCRLHAYIAQPHAKREHARAPAHFPAIIGVAAC
jgi:hypothetical protein